MVVLLTCNECLIHLLVQKYFFWCLKFFWQSSIFLNVLKYFWPCSNMQIYKVKYHFWPWSKKWKVFKKHWSGSKKFEHSQDGTGIKLILKVKFWHLPTISILKIQYFLVGILINFRKNLLILYPLLENSTTRITIVFVYHFGFFFQFLLWFLGFPVNQPEAFVT